MRTNPAPEGEHLTSHALEIVNGWNNPGERKRRAARAALERDFSALHSLTVHYLRRFSRPRGLTAPGTIRSHAVALRRFLSWAEGQHITRLNREEIEQYASDLQLEGLKLSTISRYVRSARILYRALVWSGATKTNPTDDVSVPPDPTPGHVLRGAMPPLLYARMLEQPGRTHGPQSPHALRDALILRLGGSAGLRSFEIAALELRDVDLEHETLTVQRGKGRKRRLVPISAELHTAIRAWLGVRHQHARTSSLLCSLSPRSYGAALHARSMWGIYQRYHQALKLPANLSGPHTLRRTAGTHLYMATKDLHVVADVLGHSKLDTAAIYAKLDTNRRRDALEAMENLRKTAS